MTILAALDYLTLFVHVIVCVLLIGIVLIQGGKGAAMSASFGMGAASTAFGARTDSFMTRLTGGAAVTFVVTSLVLTFLSSKTGSLTQKIEVGPQAAPPVAQEPAGAATPESTPPAGSPATAPISSETSAH